MAIALATPLPGPEFNSVEWLEKEVERLQHVEAQWSKLFDQACHDRDLWKDQAEGNEIIITQQREQIRSVKRDLVIRTQQFDALLEAVGPCPLVITDVLTPQCLTEAQQRINQRREAARNEGPNFRQTPDNRPAEGESEGLLA
jgi:hypothetical protein